MRVFIETIQQAKRELAKTYREFKAGSIDSDNAKTKVYILRAIIEANFKYEIENRIEQLESKAGLK
ncbi:MAG TPA: hypothetical protein PL018_12325 [Ignavibacteriaceae bacterium]|nr:hypothetical protein [Ignavibacteriaceae bacterium]